jgi:hypothetical protein
MQLKINFCLQLSQIAFSYHEGEKKGIFCFGIFLTISCFHHSYLPLKALLQIIIFRYSNHTRFSDITNIYQKSIFVLQETAHISHIFPNSHYEKFCKIAW